MRCIAARAVALLLALLWIGLLPQGAANAQAARTATMVLGSGAGLPESMAAGSTWMDPRGTATIADVSRGAGNFQPAAAAAIHKFGKGGALWLHLRLMRATNDPQNWLIAFPSPVLDHVTVFQQDAGGQWRGQSAGDTVAMAEWPEAGRYPWFRLDLPPGMARDVYVQVRSVTPTSLPVRLSSASAHEQSIQVEYLALGMAFGSVLLLIAACLVQAWVHRDATYAWYAGYCAITTLALMAYTGVAAHLLWTQSGFWADTAQGSLASLAAGAAMLFVRHLVGTSPRRLLDWLALGGGSFGIGFALAYPLVERMSGLTVLAAYMCFAVTVNVVVAWRAWRRGDNVGLWVLVAYVPLSMAVLMALVRVFGWLPVSFGTQYAIVAAMALEVPLLLVALAVRSRERHGAQIRELALSTQDALTGLLAPHLFHDRLRQVVARFRRHQEDAAVVFIDLVNHDRIKSQYGSAVAEQSLLRSVIKLRRLLRDQDTASRIGESRFAFIMEGVGSRAVVTDRAARLIAQGLIPLAGLKPDVTLQFHIAAVLLGERPMEAEPLAVALGELMDSMSPRTRRPIRFLKPEETQPAPLEPEEESEPSELRSRLPGED
jgi:diguanylate cyclase (GGDEF)-like protein